MSIDDFESNFDIREAPYVYTKSLREERSNLYSVSQIIIDESKEELNEEISKNFMIKTILLKIFFMLIVFAYWIYVIINNRDLGGRLEVIFGLILSVEYAVLIRIQIRESDSINHKIGHLKIKKVTLLYFAMSLSLLLWRLVKYKEKLILNIILPITWMSITSLTCLIDHINEVIIYNFKLENSIDVKDIFIVKNLIPMIKHRSNYKDIVDKISMNYDKITTLKYYLKIEVEISLLLCCSYLMIIIIIIINTKKSLDKRLITIEFLNLSMCFMLYSTFKKAEEYKIIAKNLSKSINCSTLINLDTESDIRYPIVILIISSAFILSATVLD